jgi:hypothetical protein
MAGTVCHAWIVAIMVVGATGSELFLPLYPPRVPALPQFLSEKDQKLDRNILVLVMLEMSWYPWVATNDGSSWNGEKQTLLV